MPALDVVHHWEGSGDDLWSLQLAPGAELWQLNGDQLVSPAL